jgi:hypothetical protein
MLMDLTTGSEVGDNHHAKRRNEGFVIDVDGTIKHKIDIYYVVTSNFVPSPLYSILSTILDREFFRG